MAEPFVHRNCCLAALDLDGAERLVTVPATGRPPGLLADHDVSVRALRLQPGPDVQRVADQIRVVGPDHPVSGGREELGERRAHRVERAVVVEVLRVKMLLLVPPSFFSVLKFNSNHNNCLPPIEAE